MTTRRELLSALASIPAVASVERLEMDVAKDALLLRPASPINDAQREEMRTHVRSYLGTPDLKVIIVGPGVDVSVMRIKG